MNYKALKMLENVRKFLIYAYGSIALEHEKPPSGDPDCPQMMTFAITRTKLLEVTIYYGFQKIFLTIVFYGENDPYRFLSSMTNVMENNVEFLHNKTTVENNQKDNFSTIKVEYDYSELLMKDLDK